MTQPPRPGEPHRCHFCQRPLSAFVRLGWVRTRTRAGAVLPRPA